LMAVKIREKTGDGAETRVLRDEAFLPHISTRKINCDVLALLERAIARQHGSRHEEPSIPAIEEHPECRDSLNSAPDGHKVEIITRHDVPSLLASRFPPKNREGVRGARSRGQAWGCQRSLSTPSDTSLSPEELERREEILKQINRSFYYELQSPAAKRPEREKEEEEEEEEEEDDDDKGKKEENEEEDEQQEPWRLT
jgi:hypothetical protein